MSKTKNIISLIINAAIVVSTAFVLILVLFFNANDLIKYGYEAFYFFTTDSNILSAIAALIVLIFQIRILTGKSREIPGWVIVLKYISTTAVMLTFTVVMAFLGPLYSYYTVLKGTEIYVHLFGPLLAFVSLWLFEPYYVIPKRFIHLAAIPTLIYGAVYTTEVLIIGENGGWKDFYGFNTGGMWYLSVVLIFLVTYILAIVIRLLHNYCTKKRMEKLEETDEVQQQ